MKYLLKSFPDSLYIQDPLWFNNFNNFSSIIFGFILTHLEHSAGIKTNIDDPNLKLAFTGQLKAPKEPNTHINVAQLFQMCLFIFFLFASTMEHWVLREVMRASGSHLQYIRQCGYQNALTCTYTHTYIVLHCVNNLKLVNVTINIPANHY